MNKKLITLDDLDALNIDKIKYFKYELKNSDLPTTLFYSNGEFNDLNWNSGESMFIRDFINISQYDTIKTKHYDFDIQYWEADLNVYGKLFVTFNYVDDYTYLQLLVDGETYCAEGDDSSYFTDQYMIKIYKNRGSIHSFIKNGTSITRNEYLSLLHILQSAELIKGV